jgi:copper chaperone CopZ
MLIQMSLDDVDGIESSVADSASGMTEVVYDAERVTPEVIIAEIVKAGYGAEVAE